MLRLVYILFIFTLAGCAGGKIRKQIGEDLARIVQAGDCEAGCEALKNYIDTRLKE